MEDSLTVLRTTNPRNLATKRLSRKVDGGWLKDGKTDAEIMDFMVQRYGDFVLYRPPVKSSTWLLWGGPFVLVVLSVFFLLRKLRQRTRAHGPVVLSKEDQQAAAALLGTKKDSE